MATLAAHDALNDVFTATDQLVETITHATPDQKRAIEQLRVVLAAYVVAYCAEQGTTPESIDTYRNPLGKLGQRLEMQYALHNS